MKVNGPDPQSIRQAYKGESVSKEARDERAREASEGADRVKISDRARDLQQIWEAATGSPEVRDELVQRVRDEIRGGRYRIDPERIAQALLNEFDVNEPRQAPRTPTE